MLNIVTLTKKGRNREVTYQGFELDSETGLPIVPANVGAEIFAELVNAGFDISRILLAFALGENRLRATEAIDADLFAGIVPADATEYAAKNFRLTCKRQAKFMELPVSEVAELLSKKWKWNTAAPVKKEKVAA